MHPQSLFRQMEHERFLQDTHYERRLAAQDETAGPSAKDLRAWLRATFTRRA